MLPTASDSFRNLRLLLFPVGKAYERPVRPVVPVSRVAAYSVTPLFIFLPARARLGSGRAHTV